LTGWEAFRLDNAIAMHEQSNTAARVIGTQAIMISGALMPKHRMGCQRHMNLKAISIGKHLLQYFACTTRKS
jgi:hypothetical protein